MRKIISRLAVVAGFLLAFSGCHLIQKSQAASEGSENPSNRAVANTQSECNADNYMDFIYTPGVHNCDLRGIDFSEKDVSGWNFAGAFLSGADFTEADCSGANFFRANLTGTNFQGAKCSEADFDRSILTETNFKEADLQDTQMRWVLMVRTDFRGANLKGAIFFRTSFMYAIYNPEDLDGAIINKAAKIERGRLQEGRLQGVGD